MSEEVDFLYAGALKEIESPTNWEMDIIVRGLTIIKAERVLGSDRVKEILKTLYVEEGLSIREIARLLRKSPATIFRSLHRYGIKSRPPIVPPHRGTLTPYKEQEMRRTELIEGKYVFMHYVYPFPEMAYIIGFTLGDGNFERTHIILYNTEFGFLDEIFRRAKIVADRFGTKASLFYYDAYGKMVKTREEAYIWRIILYSSILSSSVINSKGEIREDALNVLLKEPFKGHFLAGLWDADGTATYRIRPPRAPEAIVTLAQAMRNRPLLEKIAEKLSEQGIPTTGPRLEKRRKRVTYIYKTPIITREDSYVIRIRSAGILKWTQFIGEKMLHPKTRTHSHNPIVLY